MLPTLVVPFVVFRAALWSGCNATTMTSSAAGMTTGVRGIAIAAPSTGRTGFGQRHH